MLSLFPGLLFLEPAAAGLVRIAAGLVFAYLAYIHATRHREVADDIRPLLGGIAPFGASLFVALEAAIAVALIIGFSAQLAALIGAVASLKFLLFRRSLKELVPLSRLSYALLAVLCISVLFTGAGAFAFDLPL